MNCLDRQIDISAYLDGALGQNESAELLSHLESCCSCRDFCNELHQVDAFLTDVSIEAEPPVRIWNRIEAEIADQNRTRGKSWLADFFSHFEMPQLAYGFAVLLLFGLASLLALQVYDEYQAHPEYLAELDSFTVDVDSNPFMLSEHNLENPFLDSMVSSKISGKTNPFERYEEVVR